MYGAKVEGSKKSTSALEEEMVRTRTKFSIFELWYQSLLDGKAIGSFDGWGQEALTDVEPGDTVEFRADLDAAPLQTIMRLYLWFAEQAKTSGNMFSQKGDALNKTKEAERAMRMLLGNADENEEIIVLARPLGNQGPAVAMPVKKKWVIGPLGRLGGEYTVVGQIDRIVRAGEELPALRLTRDVAPTPLEIKTLKEALSGFEDAAKALGVVVTQSEAVVSGPALWLEPLAIFR